MKKLLLLLRKFWNYNPFKKYVDIGVVDFSGQGRDKYGR